MMPRLSHFRAGPTPAAHGHFARRVRWTVGALLAIALLTLTAVPALAHGGLRSSTPARGAHLAVAPREIRLTFSEAAELAFSGIELRGPDGRPVALGVLARATDDPKTLVALITGPLPGGGAYTVVWRMAGADGHPVRGQFEFVIAGGASGLAAADGGVRGEPGGVVPAPGQAAPPASHHDPVTMPSGGAFDAESPLYIAIRWLQFTALLLVLGAVAFRFAVLRFLRDRHPFDAPLAVDVRAGAARIGLWGAATLALTAVLRLLAQSYALHGASNALDPSLVGAMLVRTLWGWGWLLQLLGVLLAVAGFMQARRGGGWALATAGALALAVTPALSGHAAAVPDITGLTIAADALHVIGAGGWLGSLLVLIGIGVPAALRLDESQRGPAVADLVNAFSPTALIFAGLVGLTGVLAAWVHLGSIAALWQTAYGKTLLVKLAVLSVVAGTGAYNWLRVRPALGNVEGGRRIRRSGTTELAVGVVVLLVTAVLVATPTGKETQMQMQAATSPSDAR
jgi:putative copper export protein/methionine-rich copper-binding protein CopC